MTILNPYQVEFPLIENFEVDEIFDYVVDGILEGVGTTPECRYYFLINTWSKVNAKERVYDLYPLEEADYQALLDFNHTSPERVEILNEFLIEILTETLPVASVKNI